MGSIVVLLGIIGVAILVAYIKFPPPYAKKKQVGAFDLMVLGVCGFICLMWTLDIRSSLIDGPDDKWWPPLAIAGSLAIEIVMLGACFLLRNFWVFKPPRRPGRDGFRF